MQPPDGWPVNCSRNIRIAVFLFCAAIGLAASAFLLVYSIHEWREYGLFQRLLILGLLFINLITAVVLVVLVAVPLQLLSTIICIGALLLVQIGGTSAFTVFTPKFSCRGFSSQNACQQLTITTIGWFWTLPGVLLLCITWLFSVFVMRVFLAKNQKQSSPSTGRDEWNKSDPRSRFSVSTTGTYPPWDPPILSGQLPAIPLSQKEEEKEDQAYTDIAKDASQSSRKSPEWPEEVIQPENAVNFRPANFPHLARKVPPPLDINDDASSEEVNGPNSEDTSIPSPMSMYSALPTSGTPYRIELKLPDQPQRRPYSDSEALFDPLSGYGGSGSPATSPYPFPNPAAYTRPPFTSSPLTKSHIPLESSSSSETTAWTPPRGSRLSIRSGALLRESVFPVSPISGRLMPRPPPRSLVAVQGSRPLVDRYGRIASITPSIFSGTRDRDQVQMKHREDATDS